MKNILLPTDFSNNSINAIQYAMKLFAGERCTFYILHVQKALHYTTDDLMTAPTNTSIYHSITNTSKKKLQLLVKDLLTANSNENYTFQKITDYDVFTDAIRQVVIAKDIDLIVMGTNGASGASEVVFGSNTLQVIRKIDCPVLIIPEGFTFSIPKSILYSIDRDDHFDAEDISPLMEIMTKYHPFLRVLRIKEDDTMTIAEFDDKKNIKKFFSKYKHSFHSIINIPTADAINSFVQIMDIDMNAIFIKKETFLERFLKGSETSKISYGTRVPLIVMHNRQ